MHSPEPICFPASKMTDFSMHWQNQPLDLSISASLQSRMVSASQPQLLVWCWPPHTTDWLPAVVPYRLPAKTLSSSRDIQLKRDYLHRTRESARSCEFYVVFFFLVWILSSVPYQAAALSFGILVSLELNEQLELTSLFGSFLLDYLKTWSGFLHLMDWIVHKRDEWLDFPVKDLYWLFNDCILFSQLLCGLLEYFVLYLALFFIEHRRQQIFEQQRCRRQNANLTKKTASFRQDGKPSTSSQNSKANQWV